MPSLYLQELKQEESAEQKERSILVLESLGRSLEKMSKDVASLSKEVEGLRTDYNRVHPEVEEPFDNEGNDEDDSDDGGA
ncbi:hypothetical protein B7463_g11320, partial [Scytalidium lignicola]